MDKNKLFLILLIIILIAVNYRFIDGLLVKNFDSREIVFVERVVDGDTVIINGSSSRLLGINTPEKGEKFSQEAKAYLENLVLNKTLVLEKKGQDRYYRDLIYIFDFDSGKNINLEIVRKGYANYYFPSSKDKYYSEFVSAWESCLVEEKNLCDFSEDVCSECLILKEWDTLNEKVILKNICNFDCDISGWDIKDEGRKHFTFEDFILESFSDIEITNEDFGYDYVWTDTGDTIFLRDDFGDLVLWDGY